jgi:hypothetical protein
MKGLNSVNKKGKVIFLAILLVGIFCFFDFARAGSCDIYVDGNYDDEEDGSSEKPYQTLEKALDESGSNGKKICLKNGVYEEKITLSKGVELYGEDKNKTILKNSAAESVVLKGDNILDNLTVTGGSSGIIIEGGADITGCIIKNASKNALEVLLGSAKLIVKKTKIFGNSKGMYIQTGRNISVTDSEIYENREEGLDLREKIRGTIAGNNIYGNRESGIELIVGGSDLLIKNNSIKKNLAGGIAVQFYDIAKKTGKIKITNNIISQNKKYGLVCKSPSGGDSAKGYWNDSLDLLDNKIEDNKENAISGSCKIVEAVAPEEEKNNQIIESADNANKVEEVLEDAENSAREAELIQVENEARKRADEFIAQAGVLQISAQDAIEKIKQENKIKVFFRGNNNEELDILGNNIQEVKFFVNEIKNILNEIKFEENKVFISDNIQSLEKRIEEFEAFRQQRKSTFNVSDWLNNFINGESTFNIPISMPVKTLHLPNLPQLIRPN